jgi:FkbM family methyltransferase
MHYDLIQIGAGSYDFESCEDYAYLSKSFLEKALFIDPNKQALDRLKSQIGDRIQNTDYLCAAVLLDYGKVKTKIYAPSKDGAPRWEVSSLHKPFAKQRGKVMEIEVSAYHPYDLVSDYEITSCHRLIIDTEGMDALILRAMLAALPTRPNMVIWEYNACGAERHKIQKEMSGMGYIHTTLDKRNRLSVLI